MKRTQWALYAFVASVVLFAGLGGYLLIQQQQTSDRVNNITKVVRQATCGGGHAPANLAACHRLCPNLSLISNLKCDRSVKEVVGSNGNPPSSQPGPSGGQQTPPKSPSAPSSQPPSPNPTPSPPSNPNGVSVTTPSLPILGQPQVCVPPLLGVNC